MFAKSDASLLPSLMFASGTRAAVPVGTDVVSAEDLPGPLEVSVDLAVWV